MEPLHPVVVEVVHQYLFQRHPRPRPRLEVGPPRTGDRDLALFDSIFFGGLSTTATLAYRVVVVTGEERAERVARAKNQGQERKEVDTRRRRRWAGSESVRGGPRFEGKTQGDKMSQRC